MANENELLIFGPTYQDRSFCESADKCGVKDCPRRLTDADKEAIKKGGWVVATIPMCEKFIFKMGVMDMEDYYSTRPFSVGENRAERLRKRLAEDFRRLMKERRMSQKELSERSELSKITIFRVVNGKANVTLSTLAIAAATLGMDVEISLKEHENKSHCSKIRSTK